MMKWVAGFVVAIVAALYGMPAAAASVSPPDPGVPLAYTYDSGLHSVARTSGNVERGPPALQITYDNSAHSLAVDAASHGSSARPQPGSTWTHNDYDHPKQLARGDRARVATLTGSGGREGNVSARVDASVAAKTVVLTERQIGSVMDDLLSGSQFIKSSRTLTQYERGGGFPRANADFDRLVQGVEVTDRGSGVRTATLSNGTKVNVRPDSSGGFPTLEVSTPGNPNLKVRY